MAEKIRVLLSEQEVEKRVLEVAAQVSQDYQGKCPT